MAETNTLMLSFAGRKQIWELVTATLQLWGQRGMSENGVNTQEKDKDGERETRS